MLDIRRGRHKCLNFRIIQFRIPNSELTLHPPIYPPESEQARQKLYFLAFAELVYSVLLFNTRNQTFACYSSI